MLIGSTYIGFMANVWKVRIMKNDIDWKIVGGATYRYNLWTAKRTGA